MGQKSSQPVKVPATEPKPVSQQSRQTPQQGMRTGWPGLGAGVRGDQVNNNDLAGQNFGWGGCCS